VLDCRFVAVQYPINYSQASNDGRALRNRMIKYLVPVAAIAIALNVTKFFEATLVYGE
jgi:hypothetical protein